MDAAAPRSSFGKVSWLLIAVGVVLAGLVVWRLTAQPKEKPGRGGKDRAVSVTVTAATRRDVPVILDGLGSVVPLSTVTLRSRVDGRLDSVAFKEGQRVKAGEVIAQIDPRPFKIQLQQANATLTRDLAQLHNAQLNLQRYTSLLDQKLIAQQQLDDQKTLVEQAAGVVAIDRAAVENAKLQLEWASVTSPIDGVTGVRQVDPGNLVRASDANGLVVITQLDPIAVLFTLPQDVLPQVSEAMGEGALKVEAYARDGKTLLATGELSVIDNQINPNTATLRLKAQFANPNQVLWPNAFVKARLKVSTKKGALVIPTVAVQRGPKGPFVYVVEDGEKAAMRPIEIDSTEGELTLVRSGLEEATPVVVDGQNQLHPGAKVNLKSPPRTPDDGGTRRAQVTP